MTRKMKVLYLLTLFLIFIIQPIFAQEYAGQLRPVVGEKLTFILRWGFIPVGWATMQVVSKEDYEGHQVYHIVVEAWSNSFLSTFYKVRDRMETYMDVEGLYSWRFYKKQSEGGYHSDEEMKYDQNKHHAFYRSFKNNSTKEMDIPEKVQDALSSIYYFRTLSLKKDGKLIIDVNSDEKNWKMEVQVLDFKKNKEVRRIGTVDAFYVEPKAEFKGMFERRGRVWAWVSADRRRLPLYVKSKLPFGSANASLVKVEILKTGDGGSGIGIRESAIGDRGSQHVASKKSR